MIRNNKFVIFIPATILIAGILLYGIHYHGGNLSDDSSKWGGFGSYMTFFVNLSNLTVLIYFSSLVYRYNLNKDKEAKLLQKALQDPVLSFKVSRIAGNQGESRDIWRLCSVGNGVALNIEVCYKRPGQVTWTEPLVKCYSLAKGEVLDIDWQLHRPEIIGVHYYDAFGNQFVGIVANDVTEIRPYDEKFKDIVINGNTYMKSFFDSMIAVPSMRLSAVRELNRG